MINLRLRTEYSFSTAYGPLPKVIAAVGDAPALGICDRSGTWGHVAFEKACRKVNKRPIFGVEIGVAPTLAQEMSNRSVNWMAFIARNNAGLKEIYELTTEATSAKNFYFVPRIDYDRLSRVSQDVIIFSGVNPRYDLLPRSRPICMELAPHTQARRNYLFAAEQAWPYISVSDNFYPRPSDKSVYELIAGRNRDMRTSPMHILSGDEWAMHAGLPPKVVAEARARTFELAKECNASIPKAKMVKFHSPQTLEQMCVERAPARGVNLKDPVYAARLRRELDLISEKDFADYFFVIEDMLRYAKQHMLVGPARGSSCGSLVCYLLSITEIDPIPFGLIFERFIDVNRKDLPDIDIDFADDRRDMVFEYVGKKYGAENVARLGTVMRYHAKSAIDCVAIALHIPFVETENLKNSILERSGGDARAAFCILDTFNDLEIGKEMLVKYPHLRYAADLELHAKTTGKHAAGIVITAEPVAQFCSISLRDGATAMVDKYDAEGIGLLKIDALGLRTLSVIQDCLDQVGHDREYILKYPLDFKPAFKVINDSRFAGIFQFEGYALQSLCQQMTVDNFEDIAALGALARPGPLNSGGANEYIKRRTGQVAASSLHSLISEITQVTYGVVIYQEQVMQIARVMGRLSWEDVSSLRKAMSKSLGEEFFNQYWERFKVGALDQGVTETDARRVWENINTMGSWSFNRSHAIAYGLVSYWCCVLKSKYPLEWACACLRNASSEDQCIKLLRELKKEGYEYEDFDYDRSEMNWSIAEGKLLGGLTNVIGVGVKKAQDILKRRSEGKELTPAMEAKLRLGDTPYAHDKVFQCETRFAGVLAEPRAYGIETRIWNLTDITSGMEGEFLFFGKLVKKDLRDLNEPFFIQKRAGKEIPPGQPRLFLNMTVEDDTANILITISKGDYPTIGTYIYQEAKIDDWILWKGKLRSGFRKIYITRYLTEQQIFNRRKG